MKLNNVELPNPNKGYKTYIDMAFRGSLLGNGKWSNAESGQKYDRYSCKCKFEFTSTQMTTFYDFYNDSFRGLPILLTTANTTGFFPFSNAVKEPDLGYSVYITDVKALGMVDDSGKTFGVECVFIWAYPAESIEWTALDANYCKDGSLTFAGYDEILYPKFKPSQTNSVVAQNTAGGVVYGFGFDADSETNISKFTLDLQNVIASNIINRLVNIYRGNSIDIEGADNYFIFTLSEGYNISFTAKSRENVLKITHENEGSFLIDFDLVKDS
jgi:hypothetical protein